MFCDDAVKLAERLRPRGKDSQAGVEVLTVESIVLQNAVCTQAVLSLVGSDSAGALFFEDSEKGCVGLREPAVVIVKR